MDHVLSVITGVFPVLLLVLLNGIFVAAEFALVRSLLTKFKSPEFKDKYGVEASIRLLETLSHSISTTQLGITILSLVLGWYGEKTLHGYVLIILHDLSVPFAETVSHAIATALALAIVTFLHVVVGELAAKSIAIRHPETTLRMVATPLYILSRILRPFVIALDTSASLCLRLFGMSSDLSSERTHSTAELAMLISQSSEQGVLDKDEEEMLQGVFTFSETIAREVMTPRTDLVTISREASFREVLSTIHQSGFSRFPVIDGTADNIVGILLSRDLLPVVERYIGQNAKPFAVKDIMREPYFIPGTKSINDLLKEFRQRKLHMAIVLDEHGGVDGAVTLEDLLEEIVGDIFDESDAIESDIQVEESSGDVIVDGGVLVDDINEQFELSIPEGEYDTIAGFMMSSLGRVPQPGDQIAINNAGVAMMHPNPEESSEQSTIETTEAELTNGEDVEGLDEEDFESPRAILIVEKVTGNRVESVRLQQIKKPTSEVSEESLQQ